MRHLSRRALTALSTFVIMPGVALGSQQPRVQEPGVYEFRAKESLAQQARVETRAQEPGRERARAQEARAQEAGGQEPCVQESPVQQPRSQASSAPAGQDSNREAAERLMTEAAELRKQGTQSLPKAIEKCQAALSLWRALGDKAREGSTLGLIGQVYNEMGQRQNALEYLGQGAAASHQAGDQKWEGNSVYGIGLVYSLLGEHQKALGYYNRALPLRRETKDRFGEAITLNNLGRAYLALARYQEALESLLQALPIRRETRDQVGEAYTLNAIGSVYYTLGDYKRAIEYYDQAVPLWQSAKNQAIEAYTLNDTGFNYWALGDSQKALGYYARALSLWRVLGNHQGQAYTLNNSGMAHGSLGDNLKALDFYHQALDLAREVEDRRAEAYTLHNMGDALAAMGRDSEALDNYKQSLALKQALEDRDAEAATLAGIARLDRNRGDLGAARRDIESALDIIESLRTRVAAHGLRASYFGSKSDYYEFYVDLLMRSDKQQPGAGWDIAALRAADRARARSLLDSLGSLGAEISQTVDPALVQRERSLEQQLDASATRLTTVLAGVHTDEQAANARHAVDAALTAFAGARAAVRSHNPRYAALTDPSPISVDDLWKIVDSQTMLLEYSLGKERSFLWAVTPGLISSFELPGRPVIDAAARRVYDLMTARNLKPSSETPEKRRDRIAQSDAEYTTAAQQLSDLVLAPVAADLGTRRLVIVGDGALQYVPFGALPAPHSAGTPSATDDRSQTKSSGPEPDRPLMADHEIVTLPSALVLATLRQETTGRERAGKTLAVFADPVFQADDPRVSEPDRRASHSGARSAGMNGASALPAGEAVQAPASRLGRLRFSRAEAEAIAGLVPPDRRMIALDFAADKAAAVSAALGQYRILHFATHSIVDTEHPELSAVVLSTVDKQGAATDGYLRLFDIYNLKLSADLVVLSACQTALGREIKREGLMSLTRGFMYAGAPRVVSSLWAVDDKATAELMRLFYKGMLSDRVRPGAALKAAQLAMWKQRGSHHPYYWAAFVLQGEWE